MCFSPEMDLAAGLVVGGIAVQTARSARAPAQWPLAAIPAVFAVHQIVESVVWWGAEGTVPAAWGHAATLAYLAIAFVVVPVLIPVAVAFLEPPPRRMVMRLAVLVSVLAAATLGWSLATGPFTARVDGMHIAYSGHLVGGGWTVAAYVLGTAGVLLLSRSRSMRWWGLVNVPVIALLVWLQQSALVSLWCLWAALTSVAVLIFLRRVAPGIPSLVVTPASGSATR